jgi:precorrin-6B methylase 2
MKRTTPVIAALALALAGCSQPATSSQVEENTAETRSPDVVFVPTPHPVVDKMLEMVEIRQGDVLYDLGSGDGRIPIAAAQKHGIRSIGIDIDPQRIAESRENARKADVEHLVTFRQEDLFESDISEASVVTLYLLNTLNEKLKPKLLSELKPGTRIVSHAFLMGEWEPEEQAMVDGSNVFLWRVPEDTSEVR